MPSSQHDQGLVVIDVQRVAQESLSWCGIKRGIAVEELPSCILENPLSHIGDAAVLSWRWDVDPQTGRSRNVALALKHAQEKGIQWLLVDLISVDQQLPKPELLRSVANFANLFASIPVIAAYDEEQTTIEQWSSTLQRPWILSEIKAFCQNPSSISYVGYRHSATSRREFSFANEVSMIRSKGYAACILDILCGRVQMTNIADFMWILAEFTGPVSACYSTFNQADYLLSLFFLTAKYERHQEVSRKKGNVDYGFRTDVHDLILDRVGLERFTLGSYLYESAAYESARYLLLDGHEVAIWRNKMTSSYDRNWIEILPEAEYHIFDAVNLSQEHRDAYKARAGMRTAFLRVNKEAPTPCITEHAANLMEECWLKEIPDPRGTTLGFNPDLWR